MNPMMNVEQLWKDYCAFETVKLKDHLENIFSKNKSIRFYFIIIKFD